MSRLAFMGRVSGAWRARVLLGILMLGVLGVLLLAKKPWEFDFAAGHRMRVEDYAGIYLWWAGLVNLAGLGGLAAAAPLWLRRLEGKPFEEPLPESSRWFIPLVLLAMAACAGLNAPRLFHGLWDDEEYSVRRIVLGSYRHEKGDAVKLKEVSWANTFWYYTKPNNHFINSILGRLSNSLWRTVARPEGLQFSEVALRLPAYAAGVLSVAAWALLLWRLGLPGPGILAAWLIALHPWHMRFVPEFRGYAFVFLFLPLACVLAVQAVRSGTWRWWAAYGAAQFALFYSWPGMTFTLAVLNAGVAGLIAFSRGDRLTLFARWIFVTAVAGMACLQLYLPCAAQLFGHMDDWDSQGLGRPWIFNVLSRFLTGIPWSVPNGNFPQLKPVMEAHPATTGAFVIAMAGLIVGGLLYCLRARSALAVIAVVILLPGPAMYFFARLKDTHLFEWYVVFMVPGLMAMAAIGLWSVLQLIGRRNRMAIALACVGVLALFAIQTQPARARLIEKPIVFAKESVLSIRPSLNPHDARNKKILTVTILATPEIYDPNVHRVKTERELTALLEDADRTGRPLYINHGYANMLSSEFPDLAALIFRPGLFEKVAFFPGSEPMFDREVLRYRGRQAGEGR